MRSLDRRNFLTLATLLAPIARLRAAAQRTPTPAAAPAAISADEFLRLSQRLMQRTTLDAHVAAIYRDALVAVPANVPLLAQLVRVTAPGTRLTPAQLTLEQTILEWWYTGTYTLNGEPRLATHTGALMWSALAMPAPGTCASPFGAWSRPPRAPAA